MVECLTKSPSHGERITKFLYCWNNSNAIVILEKQHEINQKAFDKIQKTCDELLRERDAIQKELKKAESMCFMCRKRCNVPEFRLEN